MSDNLEVGRYYLLPVRCDNLRPYGHPFVTLQTPGLTTEGDSGEDIEDYISIRNASTLIRQSRLDDLQWENAQLRKGLNELVYFTAFHDRGSWFDDEKEVRDAIRKAAKALNIPSEHYSDWLKP